MRLLDRYIARIFLLNVIALFVALFAFVVGVDIFLNLRNFADAAREVAPEGASKVWIAAMTFLNVIDLWGPRLLQLFSYLVGLVLVAAMGFTLSTLVRRRELVAAVASGVSLYRLALPFLAVSGVFVGLALANQEFILPHPRIAPLLHRGADEAYKRSIDAFPVPLLRDGQGRVFYSPAFDPQSETMRDVLVLERDEKGRIERRIMAASATWNARDTAWSLQNVTMSVLGANQNVEAMEIATDLEPATIKLRQIRGYGQALSWRQIEKMLHTDVQLDDATRDRLNRIRFGRISMASCNLLAVFIALPFFLVREPRPMVTQTLKCAPLAIGAMIGGALGMAAPLPGLPVQLGVFWPAMLMAPIAIASVSFIRT